MSKHLIKSNHRIPRWNLFRYSHAIDSFKDLSHKTNQAQDTMVFWGIINVTLYQLHMYNIMIHCIVDYIDYCKMITIISQSS